ncbi:MAG: cell division protein FtsQ [Ekhidna sp.]|nr:cell division protein FtsQ [Ekhidna sp.]
MSRAQKKSILIYSFSGAIMIAAMIFSGVRNNERQVEELLVEVMDEDGNYFTDNIEIVDLLTDKNTDFIIGVKFKELEPKTLEERVEKNPFVKDAQIYRDLKGNLQVKVGQSKPIARVFTNGMQDRYIDTEGKVVPVSAKHTARVPLIETEFTFKWKSMYESSYTEQIFELLTYIEENDFWRAQIAHIYVKKNGEIELSPQVTKQTIVFGKPEKPEEKFAKLMTFYKEILSRKGWNIYKKINVKFKNQIICE